MRAILVFAVCVLGLVGGVRADECSETFPDRLKDAQNAVLERDAFLAEYAKARPALEWFEAHCRFLTELELAARKVDDPLTFVCDAKAKGRPKNLTAELVTTYSTIPPAASYQEHFGADVRCEASDRATRIQLMSLDDLDVAGKLRLFCYGRQDERCKGHQ
jgi:hypothetical protein